MRVYYNRERNRLIYSQPISKADFKEFGMLGLSGKDVAFGETNGVIHLGKTVDGEEHPYGFIKIDDSTLKKVVNFYRN